MGQYGLCELEASGDLAIPMGVGEQGLVISGAADTLLYVIFNGFVCTMPPHYTASDVICSRHGLPLK